MGALITDEYSLAVSVVRDDLKTTIGMTVIMTRGSSPIPPDLIIRLCSDAIGLGSIRDFRMISSCRAADA